MGAEFHFKHANIMAYVTSRSVAAPRLLREDLLGYLEVLAFNPRQFLFSEDGFDAWPDEISNIARAAIGRVAKPQAEETVAPTEVERVLGPLRSAFSVYPLYCLAIGRGERLREKARQLARLALGGQLLVLIPIHDDLDRNFEVLDPIPAFSQAVHCVGGWPGFIFWTTNGTSTFASIDDVDSLAEDLVASARLSRRTNRPWPWSEIGSRAGFDRVLRDHASSSPAKSRRLLHLSDLHFGTRHALQNQTLLEAELRDVVGTVDRVVITGDLIDSPDPQYATMFGNFKNNLIHLSAGQEPVVIPGNHDQRIYGIIGRDFEQVALVGSRKIVVDDNCQMIFVGFNSSESGSWARGKIPSSQFRELGGEYRTIIGARQELKAYLPIILVHHHPFSFDVPPETWVQRALRTFGLREETLLEMVNATEFHQWCADWGITTILHGHKHKARYVERSVQGSDGTATMLTAIGCGSSLGAEGMAVSYNLLEWAPSIQRWVASVVESVNGGAFKERFIALSPEKSPPVT